MDIHSASTVRLHTGRTMPIMGLGTWQLTNDTAGTIAAALALGWHMIDTSGDYGTQRGIGEGFMQSGQPRDDLFLTTKVEENEDAYNATRRNLAELRLDYADLTLIHRPPRDGAGEDLWQSLVRTQRSGLTKDIGVSNYNAAQIRALVAFTGEKPVVNQIEWSPFGWDEEMLEFCRLTNIVVQAYSPLTRGTRLNNTTLREIGMVYGKSPAQVIIRWNLQKGVVPIVKANQLVHVKENLQVFDFELTTDEMSTIDRLNERYSAL